MPRECCRAGCWAQAGRGTRAAVVQRKAAACLRAEPVQSAALPTACRFAGSFGYALRVRPPSELRTALAKGVRLAVPAAVARSRAWPTGSVRPAQRSYRALQLR